MRKTKSGKKNNSGAEVYDRQGVLGEIVSEEVVLSLDEALRWDIISGKRKRKLQDISIKLDKGPRRKAR